MKEESNQITDIYEYCDNWCDRCAFTNRCSLFLDGENVAMTADEFLATADEDFNLSGETMKEIAREEGIEMTDEDVMSIQEIQANERRSMREHPLARISREYATVSQEWFEAHKSEYEEKAALLNQEADLGVADPMSTAKRIADANEVIQWFHLRIAVKVLRALNGLPAALDGISLDADGSAKVALLAIDESIVAWQELLNYFDDESGEILAMLLLLSNMRKDLERIFPNARRFVRPGFDQEV